MEPNLYLSTGIFTLQWDYGAGPHVNRTGAPAFIWQCRMFCIQNEPVPSTISINKAISDVCDGRIRAFFSEAHHLRFMPQQ